MYFHHRFKESALVSLIFLGLCMPPAFGFVTEGAKKAAAELGVDEVIELGFEKGRITLNDRSRQELDQLVEEAVKKGQIDHIKVAVWGDREYPADKSDRVEETQKALARARGEAVRLYLENGLKVPKVTVYSMMERPNILQNTLKTGESRAKHALEDQGSAPKPTDDKGMIAIRSQASTALVFLKLKRHM